MFAASPAEGAPRIYPGEYMFQQEKARLHQCTRLIPWPCSRLPALVPVWRLQNRAMQGRFSLNSPPLLWRGGASEAAIQTCQASKSPRREECAGASSCCGLEDRKISSASLHPSRRDSSRDMHSFTRSALSYRFAVTSCSRMNA